MGTDAPFNTTSPAAADWQPAPLPADWIVAGDPQARSAVLTPTQRDGLTVGTWECTPGRFRFEYGSDETVMLSAGEVQITHEDGRTVVLRAGDIATFRQGEVAHWEIRETVRKVWVMHEVTSLSGRLARRGPRVAGQLRERALSKPGLAVAGGSAAGAMALLPL